GPPGRFQGDLRRSHRREKTRPDLAPSRGHRRSRVPRNHFSDQAMIDINSIFGGGGGGGGGSTKNPSSASSSTSGNYFGAVGADGSLNVTGARVIGGILLVALLLLAVIARR